jgi:hypothetical protein
MKQWHWLLGIVLMRHRAVPLKENSQAGKANMAR